jgi:transposase
MEQIRSDKPEGAAACAHNADAGASTSSAGPERRNSARRKLAAVTRLLAVNRWRPWPASSTSPSLA